MSDKRRPTRLSLELDAGTNPVSGRLDGPGQQTRRFSGYMELMSRIEEVRRTRRTEAEQRAEE
jgi:hypothetical protein